MKFKILTAIMIFVLSSTAQAENVWCSGIVTNVKLNTEYNNDKMSFKIGEVVAVLDEGMWSVDMQERALSLLLSAQVTRNNVFYWGSSDCAIILKALSQDTR